MMQDLGDAVAVQVLQTFDGLKANLKPGLDGQGVPNWVPLSGIVIESGMHFECVALAYGKLSTQLSFVDSCSTGMKCLPSSQIGRAKGIVLHDWHAETLAFRLFNLFILHECENLLRRRPSAIVCRRKSPEITSDHFQPFTLREDLKIYLYCSEAPCGDASMELIIKAQKDATPWPVAHRDGLLGRGYFSELGAVRRKPGQTSPPA